MANGTITDTLTNIDLVEINKCCGKILEVFEGFFRHNLEYNPYTQWLLICLKKETCLNHKEMICFKT